MAKAGDELVNPVTGLRLDIPRTTRAICRSVSLPPAPPARTARGRMELRRAARLREELTDIPGDLQNVVGQ